LQRQERKPALRPLFAVARPVWRGVLRPVARVVGPWLRFLWNRMMPGELGLELTTALAVGGVGVYVFVLYTVILSGDPGPTPADTELVDLNERLRMDTLVDVAKLVTDLGAFPTVAALVVGACVLLAVRRRPIPLVALLAGFALTWAAVQLTKAGIDRPRPEEGLVATEGSAYPSGHAAYSAAWVAVAVILTRQLGLASTAALVMGGIAISAAVGLSRLYLNVHFWSDVAGGWGLGFGIFGTLGAIAIVVAHMRQNEPVEEHARDR
jgi:membrane-associated phospholipid phosphatase